MEVIFELFGRFHPLIVHLPIGFILMGLLLLWYHHKVHPIQKVLQFLFLWASLSAVLAVSSGLMHYRLEGYNFEKIHLHLLFSVLTTLLCLLFYIKLRYALFPRIKTIFFSSLLLLLLFLSGHYGGNLTHGEDFLIEPLPEEFKAQMGWESSQKKIEIDPDKIKTLVWYEDLINPLLQQKCVSCHGPQKTKGELQLHRFEAVLKGGENGTAINLKVPEKGLLWQRIHLPKKDKKHMPPSSKTQFTKAELAIMEAWLQQGAPKETTLENLPNAHQLLTPFFITTQEKLFPEEALPPPPALALQKLTDKNILALPLHKKSNWLEISAVNYTSFSNDDFIDLMPLAAYIVSLDLSKTQVTDAVFEKLTAFSNLVILKLDYTNITGQEIQHLKTLERLSYLHLTHTPFEVGSIEKLYEIPAKEIYLFNSKASASSESLFLPDEQKKKLKIGKFELPKIASDAVVY